MTSPGQPTPPLPALLRQALAELAPADPPPAAVPAARWLSVLVARGCDRLPRPGAGATLQRWQALAQVAAHDLSLAKLYEGHTDALAILAELDAADVADPADGATTWGIWAAEPPDGRVTIEADSDGSLRLHGVKRWCSGAAELAHGLLTAWHADGRGPQLVWLAMSQPTVAVDTRAWQAVGMGGSASVDVRLEGARAHAVGSVGQYLSRPGFWHGGAGVAACWFGGAGALAAALRRTMAQTGAAGHATGRLSALGKVDLSMRSTAAVLHHAAQWIDAHPQDDASAWALRARLAAEACAGTVLSEVGRSLGATPFCRDAGFARMAADLPVFVRQSHGERDFAALGERALRDAGTAPQDPWAL